MKAIAQMLGAAGLAAALFAPAHAGGVIGGTALLNPAQHAQLEGWLGQGAFNLTKIYSLQPGDTTTSFHTAADHQGKTISLLLVGNGTDHWLVGGFNPQSWESNNTWHETPLQQDRTAFIFNLTGGSVFHQVPSSYVLPSQGQKQTWNGAEHGPAFGEGGDLWVNGSMDTAYSWLFTYGDPSQQGISVIDGSSPTPLPHLLKLEALEVFRVAVVPEPSAAGMLLAGLGVTAFALRRRRKQTPA